MIVRIQLILGIAGLSAIITYAWWLHQRVWRLRGDLFIIRDNLWLAMLGRDSVDDPSHRKFRDGINAVIRVAPTLSLFTFLRLVLDIEELHHLARDLDSFNENQTNSATAMPVREARRKMCLRISTYLLSETISGWIILTVFKVFLMSRDLRAVIAYKVEDLFDHDVFVRYNEDLSPVAREPVEAV